MSSSVNELSEQRRILNAALLAMLRVVNWFWSQGNSCNAMLPMLRVVNELL